MTFTNKSNHNDREKSLIIEQYEHSTRTTGYVHDSTAFHELRSSVVKIDGTAYCIHCGSPASKVQKKNGDRYDAFYDHIGYRCCCESAYQEMIRLVAVDYINSEFSYHYKIKQGGRSSVSNEIACKILSNHNNSLVRAITRDNEINVTYIDGSGSWDHFINKSKHLYTNQETINRFKICVQVEINYLYNDIKNDLDNLRINIDNIIGE